MEPGKTSYYVFPDESTPHRRETGSFFDPEHFFPFDPEKLAYFVDDETPGKEAWVPLSEKPGWIVKVTATETETRAEFANQEFGYEDGNLQPVAVIFPTGAEDFSAAAGLIGAWEASWISTGD